MQLTLQTMKMGLASLLPVLAKASLSQQAALQDAGAIDKPHPFIQSSIFGRQVAHEEQQMVPDPTPPSYYARYFDDEVPYSGVETFAHLNWTNCFSPENSRTFDIAIVGAPFDLGVSYRPGARFGPAGARRGARRLSPSAGWDIDHLVNPFRDWATVTDCGDIINTPFDKLEAIHELERG